MSDTPEEQPLSFEEMAESTPAPKPEKPDAQRTAPPPPPPKPAPKIPSRPVTIVKEPEHEAVIPKQPKKPETSANYEEESQRAESINIPTLVVDAVSAAIAIAFTVLFLQDVLPFIN